MPANPKIYHIVHVDRLPSIIADSNLWSDREVRERGIDGTAIGMSNIKERRLGNELDSHPGLRVGDCVPFYFCPRSVMLYVIHMSNNPISWSTEAVRSRSSILKQTCLRPWHVLMPTKDVGPLHHRMRGLLLR